MKTLFRLSLMLAVASLLSFNQAEAQGQHGHGPGKGYKHGPDSCHLQLRVNDMAKELLLTKEQEQKVLELHYAHMEKVKSLRDTNKNDCVAQRDAHLALRNDLEDAVKKLMDKDQAEKYDEFLSERKGPDCTGHQGPGPHKRM